MESGPLFDRSVGRLGILDTCMDEMCLMTRASIQRSAPSNGVPIQVVACLGNMVNADSSFVSPTLTAGTEFPSCDCMSS